MWAAVNSTCDVVTELISLGADVDIQDNVSNFLCLIMTHWQMTPKCLCKLFIQLPHTLHNYGILSLLGHTY